MHTVNTTSGESTITLRATSTPASAGPLRLESGSRVGVVGGGPAGSFFAYFLLSLAQRAGLDLKVQIYEPRDFSRLGPGGCNMCGGIISESLVQLLAAEGISLPPTVIERAIDSYMLHTDQGSVRIETPLHEKRIGAVHRGGGPRGADVSRWQSFDGYLLDLAVGLGARRHQRRVDSIEWRDGYPHVCIAGAPSHAYDLLAVAVGVNSPLLMNLTNLGNGYAAPPTTRTHISELHLSPEQIETHFGSSMHVFLLDLPRLEFAALIPKGDFVTLCILGDNVNDSLVQEFLRSPTVRRCFPPGWEPTPKCCHCGPHLSLGAARHPFGDRLVFLGDCGASRLYKDGIGSAYRTAKAAAVTAVFDGVGRGDFRRHYWPTCRAIIRDNLLGRLIFAVTGEIQRRRCHRQGLVRMVGKEQSRADGNRPMSTVLWDVFTGSAPYREVLLRTFHPAFWAGFVGSVAASLVKRQPASATHDHS